VGESHVRNSAGGCGFWNQPTVIPKARVFSSGPRDLGRQESRASAKHRPAIATEGDEVPGAPFLAFFARSGAFGRYLKIARPRFPVESAKAGRLAEITAPQSGSARSTGHLQMDNGATTALGVLGKRVRFGSASRRGGKRTPKGTAERSTGVSERPHFSQRTREMGHPDLDARVETGPPARAWIEGLWPDWGEVKNPPLRQAQGRFCRTKLDKGTTSPFLPQENGNAPRTGPLSQKAA
jgi:hypothetical protein